MHYRSVRGRCRDWQVLVGDQTHLKGALSKEDAEGPHMYKKDDYYYLLAAEDGTFEHHAITMACSKSVWGPFESYPRNSMLCAYSTKEMIQHAGHGDLFQSPDGQYVLIRRLSQAQEEC